VNSASVGLLAENEIERVNQLGRRRFLGHGSEPQGFRE